MHTRLILLAIGTAVLAVLVAALAMGVRLTGSPSRSPAAAPLVRPRFRSAPRLGLGVLQNGRLPQALAATWLRAIADRRVDLTELRGRPVAVNFWASWCLPCRREAPLLERAWREQAGRMLILGINQNDALGDARGFLRRFDVTYPSLREGGDATSRRWGVEGFPVTFFVAADGHVVAEAIGRLREAQLQRGIDAAQRDRLTS